LTVTGVQTCALPISPLRAAYGQPSPGSPVLRPIRRDPHTRRRHGRLCAAYGRSTAARVAPPSPSTFLICVLKPAHLLCYTSDVRSEERRVGKESRYE